MASGPPAQACDYKAAVDFGTFGTIVAVIPASHNPATAYDNIRVGCYGERRSDSRKQHTALLLSGIHLEQVECFGTEALEKAKKFNSTSASNIPHGRAALFTNFKLGLTLESRGDIRTVAALEGRLIPATASFPRGSEEARVPLGTLITHALRLALTAIASILADARADKIARGGTFVVDYVVTVPGGWDELAKSVMRAAAVRAGFPAEHLSLALEPECAMLAALHSPHVVGHPPEFGSNVLVVDGGGGTIDCSVSTLHPGPRLVELVPAFCAEVGGTGVDRAFDSTILGPAFGRRKPQPLNLWDRASTKSIIEVSRLFEDIEKCNIKPGDERMVLGVSQMLFSAQITPAEMALTLEDFNCQRERSGCPPISIEHCDGDLVMPRPETLFKDVLDSAMRVIHDHMAGIPPESKPTTVLLVGGFSDSHVFRHRMQSEFPRCRIVHVPLAWQAVVKGAILTALCPTMIGSRRMRHAYAFAVLEPWSPLLHDGPAPAELEPGDVPRVRVLQRIVNIGDDVSANEERLVKSNLSAIKADHCDVTLTIFQISRTDLGGEVFEDCTVNPSARRWVPHDGTVKRIPRALPAGALKMTLPVRLPPVARGLAVDNRRIQVWARFGGTELTVRAEILVNGVVVPEFSRQIPIQYHA